MKLHEVDPARVREEVGAWGLGEVVAVARLSGGLSNANYRVERRGASPLVLKVWLEQSPAQVEALAAQTRWLEDHGVPTPAPLPDGEGRLARVVEGQAWTLLRFVEGHPLGDDPTSLRALGGAMARLHLTPPPPGLGSFQLGLPTVDRLLATGFEHPFLARLARERAAVAAALPPDLPSGPVHGDLFGDNVVARGAEVVALLDFEELCVDAVAIDLGMAVVGNAWVHGRPDPARARALLEGYAAVRPLSDAERRALPALHHLATLGIAAWRFHAYRVSQPEAGFGDRYREMADRLDRMPGHEFFVL